jgi:hypothetical protein
MQILHSKMDIIIHEHKNGKIFPALREGRHPSRTRPSRPMAAVASRPIVRQSKIPHQTLNCFRVPTLILPSPCSSGLTNMPIVYHGWATAIGACDRIFLQVFLPPSRTHSARQRGRPTFISFCFLYSVVRSKSLSVQAKLDRFNFLGLRPQTPTNL